MCVFKYHAFIYFLRPPPWYGTNTFRCTSTTHISLSITYISPRTRSTLVAGGVPGDTVHVRVAGVLSARIRVAAHPVAQQAGGAGPADGCAVPQEAAHPGKAGQVAADVPAADTVPRVTWRARAALEPLGIRRKAFLWSIYIEWQNSTFNSVLHLLSSGKHFSYHFVAPNIYFTQW
jgi:hypothetical protein